MSVKDMMVRLGRGLKGKKPLPQGPLGDAIQTLKDVITEAKTRGVFAGSPVLASAEIVLDNVDRQRDCILVAVKLVDEFESVEEWTPAKSKKMVGIITTFKLLAVRARMHQSVPGRTKQ